MSLTPEERKRIYEEEKAHLEAQEQLKHESQVKAEKAKAEQRGNYWRGVGVIAAIVFGIAIVSSVFSGRSHPSSPPTQQVVEHYWVAREVVSYDIAKLPPVPRWENHRGPDGMTVQYKTRGACELAFAEHRQLIYGNSEWECLGF